MKHLRTSRLVVSLLGMALLASVEVKAGDGTWTNNVTGNWTDAGNWQDGIIADGVGSTAAFSANLTADRIVTIGASPRTIGHLALTNLNATTRSFTFSSSSGTQWLKYDPDGFGGGTSTVDVASGTTLNTGFFAGTNVIRKTGPGTFQLSNANGSNFTGGILVEEGTLNINNTDAIKGMAWLELGGGTAPVTLTSGNLTSINHCGIRLSADSSNPVTLSFGIANGIEYKNSFNLNRQLIANASNGSADIRLTGLIYGYGGIYKTGPGILRLASYDNKTGAIVVSQGGLFLQQHNGAMSGGTVVLGDANTGANNVRVHFGYGIALGSDRKFHFTDNGTGTASIGTIPGSTSASSVAGTIQIDRSITVGNSHLTGTGLTLSGVIFGTGSVGVANAAGYTTRFAAANTYEGGTTVATGTLTVTTAGKLGSGNVDVNAGATLDIDSGSAIADTAAVTLADAAPSYGKIDLASGVTETVGTLTLGTALQFHGTYGATGSGADFIDDNYFVGSGKLVVTDGKLRPTTITIR